MTFSIFFWNIWYLNQVKGDTRYEYLLRELKRFTDQYRPDLVALAEAVRPSEKTVPPVVEYLDKLGYKYSHYASMAQLDDYWMSGVTLCSRFPISQKQNFVISKDGFALKRGYENLDKEVVGAHIALPNSRDLKVIVAHPTATIDSLKQHRVGMKTLNQLVRSQTYAKNTVLVGDMNEWRLIPGSFRHKVSNVMYSRTGSVVSPTWRYNARHFTPLRLNLDYVYWNKKSDFRLKDFKVLLSSASDHQPLLAVFEYNSEVYE